MTARGLLFVLLAAAAFPAAADTYRIEAKHTSATFAYEHFGLTRPSVKVMGAQGEIVVDEDNPASSSVTATLDMATLTSGLPEFDDLLKGEKYFDVARYPQAAFRSTKVEPTGETTAKVTGDLTVRDVTRSVTFDVTFNKKAFNPALFKSGIGFTATTHLSRKAFGLSNFAPVIGDDIDLTLQIEAY
jgi:polyisoprenoid-binding protein YceI